MNSPVENSGTHCPDSMLLEEYAVRRAKGIAPDSPEYNDHLSTCEPCRTAFEKHVEETRRLMPLLANPATTPESCPLLEDLGCYLDGSLSPSERIHVESHLAHCSQCRVALATLYRETAALLAEEADGLPVISVETPDDIRNHPAVFVKDEGVPETAFQMENWLDAHESPREKIPNETLDSQSNDAPNLLLGQKNR